jgi:glycosyltransferase involved in cell wall biosynthesis
MNNQTAINHRLETVNTLFPRVILKTGKQNFRKNDLPEILFMTSYPPRECGIATYSQDLIKALNNKFGDSFSLKVCALEAGKTDNIYPNEVKYTFNTHDAAKYVELAQTINDDKTIELVVIQHEFGFFHQVGEDPFLQFLYRLLKPVIIVFHTVLPKPDTVLKLKVKRIANACESVIVMTHNASQILERDYEVFPQKISVIAHGTHLVPHLNKTDLKEKYGLTGKKVLSTFGLLSSGKSIETTLDALPSIVAINPDIVFLIIGKTHPSVKKEEGEKYRNFLEQKIEDLQLKSHVKFINSYVSLPDLLEYLQMTDIYLFTSKDPHQAVSGTFSYAMSCGCPIVSTPIPHAKEVLTEDTGILIDFQNPVQLANAVNRLMGDEALIASFSVSALQQIVPTVWENSAIAHAQLLKKVVKQYTGSDIPTSYNNIPASYNTDMSKQKEKIALKYRVPAINLSHIKKMTTDVGIIQFSIINQPDLSSGYTLDDNARALVAMCMHYEWSRDEADLKAIRIYLNFIQYCQQPKGDFLNYMDSDDCFTPQNYETNLSDANGRAIWALGYLISKSALLPKDLIEMAENILDAALPQVEHIYSTRSMAFIIKGLYYCNLEKKSLEKTALIKILADRLVQMYRHEAEQDWAWYESYLTYGNSLLPEALLCAYLDTDDFTYKNIAKTTFDFLLSNTFNEQGIKVISHNGWFQKGQEIEEHGEQPIDVAYTILALSKFYNVFKEADYLVKMKTAFNWFLGKNHLHQIIYNPCTGGCYDGLEESYVNLNQGSESSVSYLMARMTFEKYRK